MKGEKFVNRLLSGFKFMAILIMLLISQLWNLKTITQLIPVAQCHPLPTQTVRKTGTGRHGLDMRRDVHTTIDPSLSGLLTSPLTLSSTTLPPREPPDHTTDLSLLDSTIDDATDIPTTTVQPALQPADDSNVKVISVRVTSTSSVSESPSVKTTAQPDIFTTFLNAFAQSNDPILIKDHEQNITPASIQRSEFNIEETEPSSGPVSRPLPNFGLRQISNRYRPRAVYTRPRPRIYSSAQSASEPVEVRLSPAASYSIVKYGRNNVRTPPTPSIDLSSNQFQSGLLNFEPRTPETKPISYQVPEQNYEIPEHVNVQSNGKVHGVQPSNNEASFAYGKIVESYKPDQKPGYSLQLNDYREQNYEIPVSAHVASNGKIHGILNPISPIPTESSYSKGRDYQSPVAKQSTGFPAKPYDYRDQNYEVSEADNVSSNGRIHGVQSYNSPPQSTPKYMPPENPINYREQNYEVPESVNVKSNGRVHGVQQQSSSTTSDGLQVFDKDLEAQRAAANQKFGYVVEGRNYRKYRVEERTPDGFIVGEYGVVNHDDGQHRGVRYTADSTINPKLIYEALMKFLTL